MSQGRRLANCLDAQLKQPLCAEADAYNAMLDLVRRLPPTRIEENVQTLSALQPDLADDLLMATDQPLKVMTDGGGAKEFLCCEYNRDGDSYR